MRKSSLLGHKLGNYIIKRLLGRGAVAKVYYGWDEKLHRDVAIKVIEVQNWLKRSQAARFIQEARVMANWQHENIIPIYHAGEENGIYYYVMKYIDGYDLASIMSVYVEKGELMPTADVLRIGDAIASALDYAHKQGVIHRDVKPANVLIAGDGHIVLGDFGLALDLRDKSQGDVFGSLHDISLEQARYVSPEQARWSSGAVPQSDLYSLGVVLYEMLTGATPFNDPFPATLALQHISEPPPPPRIINPALSDEVEQVLIKALEKDPKDRYQSGQELMTALKAAMLTNESRKLRVFLCHSSQDKPIVRELYQRLLTEGWIDPWLDKEKLLPGQEWELEIEKSVEISDAVVVCLSKSSVWKEGYFQKEIKKVLDLSDQKPEGIIFIIPLRLDDCKPPTRLAKWQYVDYFPLENKDQAFAHLLQSLMLRGKLLGIEFKQFMSDVEREMLGLGLERVDIAQRYPIEDSDLSDPLPQFSQSESAEVSPNQSVLQDGNAMINRGGFESMSIRKSDFTKNTPIYIIDAISLIMLAFGSIYYLSFTNSGVTEVNFAATLSILLCSTSILLALLSGLIGVVKYLSQKNNNTKLGALVGALIVLLNCIVVVLVFFYAVK